MSRFNQFDIESVFSWEALDSRGRPTVAAEVRLVGGWAGTATVPSGTSKGRHEAFELRDQDDRYNGMGVAKAVGNVNTVLAEILRGHDVRDQAEVDTAMRAADGTSNLRRLGSNAVLAVSVAALLANAASQREPLWRLGRGSNTAMLPVPMVNVMSGGAHADLSADIQDFLVVPVGARSFREAAEWCSRARSGTASAAGDRGLTGRLIADEGRLKTGVLTNREAIELVIEGIDRAGLRPGQDLAIGLDVAASHLRRGETYNLAREHRVLTRDELLDEVAGWTTAYPIVLVEDVLDEDDWSGWSLATKRLEGIQVAGDDLFATNHELLAKGISKKAANAALVKPNQIGTITSTEEFLQLARRADYSVIISDRSGDTEDAWLADLAVLWQADQIKIGSTMRSERTAKWNRLLRIEAELGKAAKYSGWERLRRRRAQW